MPVQKRQFENVFQVVVNDVVFPWNDYIYAGQQITLYPGFLPKSTQSLSRTRMLVNVRSHMMFRPELIYTFDLIVNQMKR